MLDTTENIAAFQEGVEFQKDEMDKLIPFSDLMELADYVADKTELRTRIFVEYTNDPALGKERKYVLFIVNHTNHRYFDTVQELKEAMERIISPVEDQGVLLEKEAA